MSALLSFFIYQGYSRGKVYTTIFIKHQGKHTLLVQVYVDHIIFGSTSMQLVKKFSKLMQGEFEMSLMGELNYFLGLQIKQLDERTFLCQTKYYNDLLKEIWYGRLIDTPMPTNGNLERNENGKCHTPKLVIPFSYSHLTFDLGFICTHSCFIHMHYSFMIDT